MKKGFPLLRGKAIKTVAFLFLVTPITLLWSCSLLPVEEVAPAPPLLRSYEKTEYNFVEVFKGDIVDAKRITCQYSPALEETLAFSVGNILIDIVNVENGDVVQKGEILAELERSDLVSKIDTQTLAIKKLKLSATQLSDTYKLNLQAANIKLDTLRDEYNNAAASKKSYYASLVSAQEKAIQSLTDNYELQLDINDTELKTSNIKLADLQKQYDARILVAGISGTVTFVKKTEPNSVSIENEKFVTLADKTSSVFIVSGEDASYLKPGDAVAVLLSDVAHEATVISATDLGLEVSDRIAYVRFNQTAFDIKERATGTIKLVLETRKDVLYIPLGALKSANGKKIVYLLDQSGIKTIREVETGFIADNKVEILSGLEAGEQVIIE